MHYIDNSGTNYNNGNIHRYYESLEEYEPEPPNFKKKKALCLKAVRANP